MFIWLRVRFISFPGRKQNNNSLEHAPSVPGKEHSMNMEGGWLHPRRRATVWGGGGVGVVKCSGSGK